MSRDCPVYNVTGGVSCLFIIHTLGDDRMGSFVNFYFGGTYTLGVWCLSSVMFFFKLDAAVLSNILGNFSKR